MWFGMKTDAVIKDERQDDADVGEERGRPAEDQPGTTSSTIQCSGIRKRSIFVSFGPLEEIADGVVAKGHPVERRERPERPLLDPRKNRPSGVCQLAEPG